MRSNHRAIRRIVPLIAAAASVGLVVGCAATGPDATGSAPVTELTLVTHDSFSLGEGVLEQFTTETGIEVSQVALGDGGSLANQLALTAGAPVGDVVFGIDTTFASRVAADGILEPYVTAEAAETAADLLLPPASGGDRLTPIDYSDVCVNADLDWFAEHDLAVPTSLADLVDPTYADLFVTPSPATSSPGLAFLLTTIAADPDGWPDYWAALIDNGAQIAADWESAYYVDFSGPSSEGQRPLVLSYASSPPYEVQADGSAPTAALLDTCFRQVEYAGVIAGTGKEAAAQQLVDFLWSTTAQDTIPEAMYVYPANPAATLPESWVDAAPLADDPFTLDPADIDAHRQEWIEAWSQLAGA